MKSSLFGVLSTLISGCASSTAYSAPTCQPENQPRHELRLTTADQQKIFVISVKRAPGTPAKGAVVFTHGAGSGGTAVWDLPGQYSFMRKLACLGFDSYAFDVRGFGGSPLEKETVVRARDAQPDLEAVMTYAKKTSQTSQLDLVGWSWGCVVAGLFASEHPTAVRSLVLFAPVWDRKWPKRHSDGKSWRSETRAEHLKYFNAKVENKKVLDAYVDGLFRFSEEDSIRLPNGPYRDIYGEDAPIWDATKVQASTLIVRGENDRASLHDAAYRLFQSLTQAKDRRFVELANAGHFAFRTYQAFKLQRVILDYLDENSSNASTNANEVTPNR